MKNKNLMLLVGVGLAYYLFYKMYAKKSNNNVIKTPGYTSPVLNDIVRPIDDIISVTNVPNQFLVDKVPTAELSYDADTYQTYYGSMAGHKNKVPSTCYLFLPLIFLSLFNTFKKIIQ